MNRRVGNLLIESMAAESAKFTAPMLLLHGLWCTAGVWRRYMGYLAHRGWTCHALNLRGHGGSGTPGRLGRVRFTDYLDDVRRVIAACEAPPVLLGHDLGGLLALHAAALARAVVALAPLVPQPMRSQPPPAFSGFRARLAMRCGGPLPPPRGKAARDVFGQYPPAGLTAESGTVARELSTSDLRFAVAPGVPALVVGGQADACSSAQDLERLATYAGAVWRPLEGAGHGLPWEPGWERCVGDIHRWLVQQCGEALLVLREEDEE